MVNIGLKIKALLDKDIPVKSIVPGRFGKIVGVSNDGHLVSFKLLNEPRLATTTFNSGDIVRLVKRSNEWVIETDEISKLIGVDIE